MSDEMAKNGKQTDEAPFGGVVVTIARSGVPTSAGVHRLIAALRTQREADGKFVAVTPVSPGVVLRRGQELIRSAD
jgi:hypothetical protein